MLELGPVRAAVVRCLADKAALDRLPQGVGAAGFGRIAPDEAWLLGPLAAREELARGAGALLAGADPDALVVDDSDGWSAWTLSGPQAGAVLSRLSDIVMPPTRPAFLQGALAEVPGKVLAERDRLHLIVPAQFQHHLARRITQVSADLDIRVLASQELSLGPSAARGVP